MTNFIKKEQLVGSQKVVVGEKYNDLVLRTLGKVYIQTGSKFTLLTEYLDKAAGKASADNILIWNDESDLTDARYPGDGVFVFTASSKSLYLTYEGVYIPIIETDAADINWGNIADKFVSKSGDYIDNYLNVNGLLNANDGTFSNPVTIKSKTAPLKVFSKEMVENFNSEHVGGKRIDEIAVKAQNESILGKWDFANITSFKDRVNFSDDLVNGDGFAPGFTGYGWMLDNSTCTLTIDNLIVRKAMHVYELVVNKISATNGSLWVSDSAKIKECESIEPYKDLDDEGNEIIINHPLYEERESPDFNKTPSYPESNSDFEGEEDLNGNTLVNIYDTYFTGSFYYILLDEDYCPFRLNDLLRCQRFTGQSIKYYDGIVTNVLKSNEIIIRLSPSLNDTYNNVKTEVVESEDEEGNKFQELKTTVTNKPQNQYEEVLDEEGNVIDYKEVFTTTYDKSLTSPEEGDGLVRIGNSSVRDRMGAVYITSSDVGGPYIDILSEVITPNFNKITKYNESENKEVIHKCLKTRLGNLNNIYDPDFIQQPYGYGLYSENVFLKGKFVQVDSSGSTKPIPIYKGIWKESEQYYHGDQVTHNGELYYALKSSCGNDPSLYPVYWELAVSKGENGEITRLSLQHEPVFKYSDNFNQFVGPQWIQVKYDIQGIYEVSRNWYIIDSLDNEIQISTDDSIMISPTDELLKLSYSSLKDKILWVDNSIRFKIVIKDHQGRDYSDESSIIKISSGAHAYNITIISTKGDVFKDNLRDTRLKALVYHGGELVDDEGIPKKFKYEWQKYDKNGIPQEFTPIYYEQDGFVHYNSILITDEDVSQRSTFNCIIYKNI